MTRGGFGSTAPARQSAALNDGFRPAPDAALKAQAAALRSAGVAPRTAPHKALTTHADAAKAHQRAVAMRSVAKAAQTAGFAQDRAVGGAGYGWSGPLPSEGAAGGSADPRPWALLTPALQVTLLRGVQYGVMVFTSLAYFRDVAVNGPIAAGGAGCLTGPDIAAHVVAEPFAAALTRGDAEIRDATADGVAACFAAWRDAVTVPNLTWWPAFAAVPAAEALPMANVPTPLAFCVSAEAGRIVIAGELVEAIVARLPPGLRTQDAIWFCAKLAAGLSAGFAAWLTTAHATNVMGRGPVPLFQPPFSTFGPVSGGSIIAAPGHLATSPPMAVIPTPL